VYIEFVRSHKLYKSHSFLLTPPMKVEKTGCAEMSARKIQMPLNRPKERIQHSEQSESLKSRSHIRCYVAVSDAVNRTHSAAVTQDAVTTTHRQIQRRHAVPTSKTTSHVNELSTAIADICHF
jgi:tRNA A58 N-methylase Trm61